MKNGKYIFYITFLFITNKQNISLIPKYDKIVINHKVKGEKIIKKSNKFIRIYLPIIIIVVAMIIYNKYSNVATVSSYEEYYNIVEEKIINFDSKFSINIKDYDADIYTDDVLNQVVENNHQIRGIYLGCTYTIDYFADMTTIIFNINYSHDKQELISRNKELKEKIEDIVDEVIKPNMKPIDKEKVLHDYIINNCKYDMRYYVGDMPDESYTAYGVLINGIGVCEGYAVAMKMLLDEVGIESIVITGDAYDYSSNKYEPHAWNLVNLDGEYYQLDPTWNDPVSDDGRDNVSYAYFNLTDEEMKIDHRWQEKYYPKCVSTKYSFDNSNFREKDENGNEIITVANKEELFSYLRADISAMKSEITYKIKYFNGDVEGLQKVVESAYESLQQGGKYSFSYTAGDRTESAYVTFYFQ